MATSTNELKGYKMNTTQAAIREAIEQGRAFSLVRSRRVQEGAWGDYSQAHWLRFVNL